jgi:hypothetical protein
MAAAVADDHGILTDSGERRPRATRQTDPPPGEARPYEPDGAHPSHNELLVVGWLGSPSRTCPSAVVGEQASDQHERRPDRHGPEVARE